MNQDDIDKPQPSKMVSVPLIWLVIFLVFMNIGNGLYAAWQIEPSFIFSYVQEFGLLWVICWWLKNDNREYKLPLVYDWKFLLLIGWMFFLPYYVFKTRGVKGVLTILSFLGILIGAYLLSLLVYYLLV